jgi:hypothetical protein
MKTIELNFEQRSPEWFNARLGCVTGSGVANVLAKLKTGGEAATRRQYRTKLAVERLTRNVQEDGFFSSKMQWGIDQEKFGRGAYESLYGLMVRETGFIKVKDEFIGYSPDGFNGSNLIEIKCPDSTTHFEYLEAGRLPSQYKPQVQFGLWVTDAEWCDFVSYDPRFPEHLQLFVVRVERDEDYIKSMSEEVNLFNDEVSQLVNRMEKK